MNSSTFNDLEKNLSDQINIFGEVLSVNRHFRDSIIEKEWNGVNKDIEKLTELSVNANNLDNERVYILIDLAKTLHSTSNENCYSIIHKAPKEERDKLLNNFYKLKNLLIQVKSVFKGINSFVEHKKDMSRDVIDVLLKDAKGNVYNKPGRKDFDGQGFLVNKQL